MPTILLKKSDTASAVPTTANLTNLAGGAEVAVNTADRRMFTMNSSSAVVELGTNPSSLTVVTGANLATTSGNVGIGTTSTGFNAAGLPLVVGSGSGNTGMTIYSGAAGVGSIHFGDTVTTGADSYRGFLNYNHSTNTMQLGTDATARINIDPSGNVGIAKTSSSLTLDVSGTIGDLVGNVRNIPSAGAAKTSTYTLAISDIGEFVTIGSGGGIDVPNGIFSAGNAVSIYNDTTGNRTISLTITTAYIAGTDSDKASVTLATRGVATILFISNSVCVVTGNVT